MRRLMGSPRWLVAMGMMLALTLTVAVGLIQQFALVTEIQLQKLDSFGKVCWNFGGVLARFDRLLCRLGFRQPLKNYRTF
jgi:hypothetical protein